MSKTNRWSRRGPHIRLRVVCGCGPRRNKSLLLLLPFRVETNNQSDAAAAAARAMRQETLVDISLAAGIMPKVVGVFI